ncbi:MAG: hypothetical protein ACO1QB_06780 [Verrucomicrobiales bacterium]
MTGAWLTTVISVAWERPVARGRELHLKDAPDRGLLEVDLVEVYGCFMDGFVGPEAVRTEPEPCRLPKRKALTPFNFSKSPLLVWVEIAAWQRRPSLISSTM